MNIFVQRRLHVYLLVGFCNVAGLVQQQVSLSSFRQSQQQQHSSALALALAALSSSSLDQSLVENQLGYLVKNFVCVSCRTTQSGKPVAIQTYPLQGGSPRRQAKAAITKGTATTKGTAAATPIGIGAPFPTLYWLTEPLISRAIGDLERQGYVASIEEQIRSNDKLSTDLIKCHQEYANDRWNSISCQDKAFLTDPKADSATIRMRDMLQKSGIAGTNLTIATSTTSTISNTIPSLKCLHTHYAHYRSLLAAPTRRQHDDERRTINPVGQLVHDQLIRDFSDLEL
mmetsp:Transcript_22179/g.28694  ORF Transcript_22179/g.28694 Transcript_22179/m.28694 type:complete len:286 (-) Transcript_22179:934-1791(-)|eukprot:CAMPEP_0198147002 /NCGR_PEP_ID=MMETSP1443-20131203/32729_1 /TAXON_ID=186043 /ORGANISM="Entomoneis sp., Strain CCMP2396" /LENGTH=285 /DNA_ID=CAMNT_0043811131 /DNA_START=119 /DNA_END=976 /DNA_ORIENTATION=+